MVEVRREVLTFIMCIKYRKTKENINRQFLDRSKLCLTKAQGNSRFDLGGNLDEEKLAPLRHHARDSEKHQNNMEIHHMNLKFTNNRIFL